MDQTDCRYSEFVEMLRQQMLPAMGCTEPIAIAYAAALGQKILTVPVEEVWIRVSGNIIKNAKSVVVPNTNGRKGIETACAIGLVAGDSDKKLQVISEVTEAQRVQMEEMLKKNCIHLEKKEDARLFDIEMTLTGGTHKVEVRIADGHTNVVFLSLDNRVLKQLPLQPEEEKYSNSNKKTDIATIFDFADTCNVEDLKDILDCEITYNTAIAREGINGNWGAGIGRVLLYSSKENDVKNRAKAYAAAGSDARMSGCEMPVVINSGSGNQGLTVSIPVIEYATDLHSGQEKLYRALILSNLVAIHQKQQIGCLSAYCGAISAGCAAGAGIAYLQGGDLNMINHTIVNALAILSGTICDGAKPSCAAKIASAVEAGILAVDMAKAGKEFRGGEGIVKKGVENTIRNVGLLCRNGMKQTDEVILDLMLQ